MKKTGIINQPIAAVIGGMGHTDTLTIADAGLPIPPAVPRIDLALTRGVPGFLETLRAVLEELFIERALVAEEMREISSDLYQAVRELLGDVPVDLINHPSFKERTSQSRAIIRTGEFTPYANIILVAGAWGFQLPDGK